MNIYEINVTLERVCNRVLSNFTLELDYIFMLRYIVCNMNTSISNDLRQY